MSQSNRPPETRENYFFSDKTYHQYRLKKALQNKEGSTVISSILLQGSNFIPLEEKKNTLAILHESHNLNEQKHPPTNSFLSNSTLSSSSSDTSNSGCTDSSKLILNFLNISNPSLKNEAIILALTAYVAKNDLKNFDYRFKQIYPNIMDLQKWMEIAIANDADKIIEYLHNCINENLFSPVQDETSIDFVTEEIDFLELAMALKKPAAIKTLKKLGYTCTTLIDNSLSQSTISTSTISTISALFTLPKLTENKQNRNEVTDAKKEEPSCCIIT